MQLKFVALSALVAAASAQIPSIPASDLGIIASALPSSADAFIAKSGAGAFYTKVASEFAAGSTPGWFTKLPTSIQTILVHVNASAVTNLTSIPPNVTVTKAHTTITSKRPVHLTNTNTGTAGHTRSVGQQTATNTKASAESSSGAAASSSSSSKGGASMPTAMVGGLAGAGLAGAVGIVGLLAL